MNIKAVKSTKEREPVSTFCFVTYIYFVLDFFLHFSARIPAYGMIRPTILLVVIISISLIGQRHKFINDDAGGAFKAIKVLLVYLVVSLPLVEWPGSALNNLSLFVKAIVFLFFTALIIDTDKRLKIFLFVFVSTQVFRAFEPLYLNITSGYWGSSTHLGHGEFADRLSGAPADVINPNGLGFVIVTAVPFLYYLLFGGRWKSKVVFLVILPPLIYTLLLTMSRGAMIALVVVAWVIFKDSKNKFSLIAAGILGVAIMWGALNDNQKDRYLSLVSSDAKGAKTSEGRLKGMIYEFSLGFERPIVGHGLGTTSEAKVHNGKRQQAAHNLYAEILIEIGLIGFVIFVSYITSLYKIFLKNRRLVNDSLLSGSKSDFYRRLNLALTAVFWMYLVYSLNYFGLSVYYWYLFGGLVIAFGRIVNANADVKT